MSPVVTDYRFKTQPFDHQAEDFLLSRDAVVFGFTDEQGTGKSKKLIDTVAWLFLKGKITGVLVIAPNGVHRNWILNEIPAHMPDYIQCVSAYWSASPNKEEKAALQALDKPPKHMTQALRFLAVNVEAVNTKRGRDYITQFINSFRCVGAIDESTIIKNPSAGCTKQILAMRERFPYRRLLNGTLLTQGPEDVWSQMNWLDPEIIGIPSLYSFRARYCQIVDVAAILAQGRFAPKHERDQAMQVSRIMQRNPKAKFAQFVLTDDNGKPQYQRIEELRAKIAPYITRRTKADCLDLPEKLFTKRYVELSDRQRRIYDQLRKGVIAEMGGMQMTATLAFTKMLRLQQVVGGFFVPDAAEYSFEDEDFFEESETDNFPPMCVKTEPKAIDEVNPRIASLMELLEEVDGKVLIWARFRAELGAITQALRDRYGFAAVCELHGGIDPEERQASIKRLQEDPALRFAVGNPQAKGVSRGQTMTAVTTVVYYSNSFSLDDRLQSEDRAHRIGQKNPVTYIDLVAPDTLDEKVIDALRSKKELADLVNGDRISNWI